MVWQAVVMALQILMLAVGWQLFQKARADLSAHAMETPVLGEIKALHRSIKQLLQNIEETGDEISSRVEARCAEARHLLEMLDRRLEAVAEAERGMTTSYPRGENVPRAATAGSYPHTENMPRAATAGETSPFLRTTKGKASPANNYKRGAKQAVVTASCEERRQKVYEQADAGNSPAVIAQATGLSEGEVETLLGLRLQRR